MNETYVIGESLLAHLFHMVDYFVKSKPGKYAARIVELASTLAAHPFVTNLN
jgi:hypothetical protein